MIFSLSLSLLLIKIINDISIILILIKATLVVTSGYGTVRDGTCTRLNDRVLVRTVTSNDEQEGAHLNDRVLV